MTERRLRVVIQRDPVEGSKPGETSHLLAREAQARGHEVLVYTPAELCWQEGRVTARGRAIHYADGGPAWTLGPHRLLDLADADVVLVRQDPPVDMGWLTTTWLLDRLPPTTLVLNPPGAIRDTPEKLVPLELPHRIPPTLVTADPAAIRAFRDLHGDLVIKPLFDKAGAGIWFLDRDDPNLDVVLESWLPAQRAPVAVQRYQAEAREGSIRILVVGGEPCAALRSVPHPGKRRGNMDRSARVEPTVLTGEQGACVAEVAALLARRGIVLAAVDLVGPWLLEVNVTSPGGVVYYDRVYPEPLSPRIWDAIERCHARRRIVPQRGDPADQGAKPPTYSSSVV